MAHTCSVYCIHNGRKYEATAATYTAAISQLIHIIGSTPNGKANHYDNHTVTRSTADADRDCTTAAAQSIARD